ncbi:hypothetical protein cand_023550 [Cryptosporidium andersoni]|uniref:Uncharacterized protein n=1 Tax=Cryptosporidium andersoni TaxID=117008 RepID=A0A1J4MVD9_9CRYT|nr:hypothetical protein cand_023550 [Cryptosporidium andersoni]
MSNKLFIWSKSDIETLFSIAVDLFNDKTNREAIRKKVGLRMGISSNPISYEGELNSESRDKVGVVKFASSKDDIIGQTIDSVICKNFIIAYVLPDTTEKSHVIYQNIRQKDHVKRKIAKDIGNHLFTTFSLKLAIFTESLICHFTNLAIDSIKKINSQNILDISLFADPLCYKGPLKLNNLVCSELDKYGISLFSGWLGEDLRSKLVTQIQKYDYQALFTNYNTLTGCYKLKVLALHSAKIKEVLLTFYKSLCSIPYELNMKLKLALHTLPPTFHVFSLSQDDTLCINKQTIAPGSKVALLYFPSSETLAKITCTRINGEKGRATPISLEVSNDKLIIVKLMENKYTIKVNGSNIIYFVIIYIYGPEVLK